MKTLRISLIGGHIGRSRFAAAQEIMCRTAGLRLDFRSIDTAGREDFDLCGTIAGLRAEGRTGTAITHPHKSSAVFCDDVTIAPEAAGLGAINLMVFAPNGGIGHNTDHSGFIGAWRAGMGARKPGKVAIAGAGGVARAIGPALARMGAEEIVVWDLTEEPALDLAHAIGPVARAVHGIDAEDAARGADGLVNCTPLGMAHYDGSAFDAAWMGGQRWAFDAVYTPTDTAFLNAAAAAGLTTLTGFDMFRNMAMDSFERFTGIRPDRARTLAALETLRPTEDNP